CGAPSSSRDDRYRITRRLTALRLHARRSLSPRCARALTTAARLAPGDALWDPRSFRKYDVVEHGLGQQLLEPGVLFLERAQASDLGDLPDATLRLPPVDRPFGPTCLD